LRVSVVERHQSQSSGTRAPRAGGAWAAGPTNPGDTLFALTDSPTGMGNIDRADGVDHWVDHPKHSPLNV